MDVNIHDKRGQEAIVTVLAVIAAVAGGILVFGLIPGVLVTSVLNYFFRFTNGQLWGLSLLFSVGILFLVRRRSRTWTQAVKRYVTGASIAGVLVILFALFFNYNFSARTIVRMFNVHSKIPYKYLTAPSEVRSELPGLYAGESYNKTYNSKGEVELTLFDVNTTTDSLYADVQWTHGLSGYNKLRGTLKNGHLTLRTIPYNGNNAFTAELAGEVKDGKVVCTYVIRHDNDGEVQEGNFSGLNIKDMRDYR